MQADLSTWPTKTQAAEQLGISVRALERRIEQHEIEALPRKRNGKRPETVCNPRDVDRLKPAAHVMPAAPSEMPGAPSEKSGPSPALQIMAALTAGLQQPRQPIRWLTIEEAAAQSGISSRSLKLAVKDQQHRAALDAWRDGRKWKISSVKLNSYTPSGLPPLARKSPTREGKKSPQ